jgi:type I restriction enzyme R subunit
MAVTPKDLSETGFEEYIQDYLVNHGYLSGVPQDFNKEYALDTKILFDFLEDSQPRKMQKLKDIYKDQYKFKITSRIDKELNKRGMIDVLRHGIKDYGVQLDLAYFKPATSMNEEMVELYNKNRISVTRQIHYSTKNENSVDLTIFINGLPVAVLELKNPFTGQTYEHAIAQFKKDRHPAAPLFRFKKRAIVFFAVDTDEAYMTTRLAGNKTVFLPFNKGNEGGKGNPPQENGFRTAYLWEEVLEKESLLDILKRFIHVETKEEEKNGKKQVKETLLFPRYHQLDAVRKLEKDAKASGVGKNYLIQHSAGSGKTNSISWLAHRLAHLHNINDNPVFDNIVIVTDRRTLDKQLQDSVYQLDHKHGVVQKVEKDSAQLASSLKGGARIIISTLQKFPFILEKVSELGTRKYAVIIDEAHSSTSGETMGALREALSADSLEEASRIEQEAEDKTYDPEEEILEEIRKRGIQPNISFFAFTATPKAKTLETFGTTGEDNLPKPFHLYSMRQAIEEGFILDVLQNYVTYETYFKIAKKIEDDPAFERAKATKALTRFVSLHPHNIAQKTEIIIEHFRNITMHKIGGRAKAMVVTSSRLHAVRYKIAFDNYIKKKGYKDLKTLVAFSGTVKDGGISYSEPDMNKIKESETAKRFDTDEYQVLIVAEKYQTGFDQPLLHTMFVDKKLTGLKAVQTLSRLNRTHPSKDDTFILDFVNKAEDIQEAFKPYYEASVVEEVTDPNILYDLETELNAFGVYDKEEVERFINTFYKKKRSPTDKAALNNIIDKAIERFKSLEAESREDFSSKTKKFLRLYSFVIQITPFTDVELHKLYIYLSFMVKKLPKRINEKVDLLDEVALEYYTNKKIFEGSLSLDPGADCKPLTPAQYAGSGKKEDEKEELSSIIERLNQRFGTEFTKADMLSVEQIKEDFARDEDLVQKAKTNNIDDFKYAFSKAFMDKVVDRMGNNEQFFTRILDDEEFRSALMDYMLAETYERLREESV